MKLFVIDGINLLEKFMDWIGESIKDMGRECDAKFMRRTVINAPREKVIIGSLYL